MMTVRRILAIGAGLSFAVAAWGQTPLQPAVSYQGRLKFAGNPAAGTYDLSFTLWDAAGSGSPPLGGTQIGAAVSKAGTLVSDGLFTVILNESGEFGPAAFAGDARWLQIEVNGTPLSPRQPLTAAPFAVYALNAASAGPWAANGAAIYNTNSGNVGIGEDEPIAKLHVAGDLRGTGRAAFGNEGVLGVGLVFERIFDFTHRITQPPAASFWCPFYSEVFADPAADMSALFVGHRLTTRVQSLNPRNMDFVGGCDITAVHGGTGVVSDLRAAAVFATAAGPVTEQVGLHVSSDGISSATIGSNRALDIRSGHRTSGGSITDDYSVYINSPSRTSPLTNHYGIYLANQGSPASFPTSYAIYSDGGQSYFRDAVGIGIANPQRPLHIAATQSVAHLTTTNHSSGSVLVLQNDSAAPTYLGAINFQTSAAGTPGQLGYLATHDMTFRTNGVEYMRITADGDIGIGTQAPDVPLHVAGGGDAGLSAGGYFLIGVPGSGNIVMDQNEIMARNNGAASALFLNHEGGDLVIGGLGNPGNVGIGTSSPTQGKVQINVANQRCIHGTNNSATFAAGYFENNGTGPAGVFEGNVTVIGSLSKSSGSFRIDHPLDPANKYLYHSFVESPDMKNLYDGVVVTDERGYATVEMPDWFEPLNRDFRYQLTVIDAADDDEFVLAKIVREIANRSFVIRTSRGAVKVSWQVTGTRQDPWAEAHRIPVEEVKPEHERGKYQHPELYGLPKEMGINSASRRAENDQSAGAEDGAGGWSKS